MGRHYQILLPLLSLFFVRVDLTDLIPLNIPVELIQVLDGDSLEVSKGNFKYRVRLTYVDAPESGQKSFKRNFNAGLYAKDCLKSLLPRKFKLTIHGFDQYHRVLGEVEGVNLRLVRKGCVSLYPYTKFTNKYEKSLYVRAYFKARNERVGLWKYGGFKNPMSYRQSLKRKSNTRSRGHHFVSK